MHILPADFVTARIVIRPAEVPACELPESEPTTGDLLAIEYGDDVLVQRRIDRALELAAYEQTHRELMDLRRQLGGPGEAPPEYDVTPPTSTTFWRAA